MTLAHEAGLPGMRRADDTAIWTRRLARWIPALMLAYGLLIWPVLYGRSPDTGPAFQVLQSESSALSQIYFPLLLLAAGFAWIATSYGRRRPLDDAATALIALFVTLCLVSALWSVAPGIALRRAVLQVAIVAALILSVRAAADPDGVVARIFWTLAAIMLVNLAMVAVKPAGPLGHEGVYPQKNGLGAAAALAILFALHQLFAGARWTRVAALLVIAVAVLLLVLSRSKTSLGLAALVPAIALAAAIVARATRLSPAVLVGLGAGLAYLVYAVGVAAYLWDFPAVATALFGDPTLTTRTEIWDFALPMTERRPWLGFGFESFWQAGPDSPSLREARGFVAKMPHAHNGYIDILLQLGRVGLALLMVILFAALHACGGALRARFGLGWLCLALMLFTGLYNFLESAWFRGFDFFSMSFVLATALTGEIRRSAAP
ncbi:O-antigen ligase family protein [Prosthecodimorpha hirschii]|uniref:O-antigen ligase family protein n=1 Tax=Prosthecodimorpha hirschii TaxID=665126 RepID=UPI0015E3F1A4|nr:O-antigen ligase family protein [Prosthecomicrobium hirschii]